MTENLLQHTYSKQNPELENYSAVLKRFFVELFHKNIRAKSPRFPQELLVRIWWKFPGTTRISFPSTQPLSVTPWMIASCSHTPHCQSLTINRSAHNKQCWLTSDRRVKTEQGSTGFFFPFYLLSSVWDCVQQVSRSLPALSWTWVIQNRNNMAFLSSCLHWELLRKTSQDGLSECIQTHLR